MALEHLLKQAVELHAPPPRGGGKELNSLHPAIRGLIAELPPAKSEWSVQDQADWLLAAARLFKIVYKGRGTTEIKVAIPRNEDGG